jgi:thiamine-monophosphate kinase
MRVSELGEFALIARLQERLQGVTPSHVMCGVGDDCAVLRPAADMELLLTTDTQEEGVHFRRDWASAADIGWRCLAVNVSDIAAMGGSPLGALVALSLPATLEVAFVEALYDGMQAVAQQYSCPVIGGNISQRADTLSVTITVVGQIPCGQSVYRAGAQVGDEIWVTGALGAAKAGLEVLSRPQAVVGLHTADVLRRYRRPQPRLFEAQYLRQQAQLHSLLDISDGLSSDLRHICEASGVGAELEAAAIPVTADVRQIAVAVQVDPLLLALHGGEDFELCLTASPGSVGSIQAAFHQRFHCPLVRVGTIQPGHGVQLRLPHGEVRPLPAQGYDHFRVG